MQVRTCLLALSLSVSAALAAEPASQPWVRVRPEPAEPRQAGETHIVLPDTDPALRKVS